MTLSTFYFPGDSTDAFMSSLTGSNLEWSYNRLFGAFRILRGKPGLSAPAFIAIQGNTVSIVDISAHDLPYVDMDAMMQHLEINPAYQDFTNWSRWKYDQGLRINGVFNFVAQSSINAWDGLILWIHNLLFRST